MAVVSTSLVRKRHAWTGLDVPWNIDVDDPEAADVSEVGRGHWRLYHYLSGGGLRGFSGSAARELVSRRQTRFLVLVGALFVLWLVFRSVSPV